MSSVTLIDTDALLSSNLEKELSRRGLAVETFNDAAEVMSRKDGTPDLIVLCIDPKRTGWAVCNRLRKSATLKTVPLIITSAEATEKDFEDHKKLKTRAEEYLHKPFGVEALIEKIGALIGLPEPLPEEELALPVDSEEISVEDENMLVEEEEALPAAEPPIMEGFGDDDGADQTRVGMQIDGEVDAETDAAFAGIAMDRSESTAIGDPVALGRGLAPPPSVPPADRAAHRRGGDDPFALPESPFEGEAPGAVPEAEQAKTPSVDLDLGLDQVAHEASQEPRKPRHTPPPGMPVLSSAPPPPAGAHDTSSHDTNAAAIADLKREKERLQRELDELRTRPAAKPEGGGGFSREREFLNLREIINKKEKEILDLRDTVDAKDRQVLDGKDKLRELERRARDLDEKVLGTEKELVAAREKIEALTHDKERVLEREKQVKARLEDAQKTIQRNEEEIETWKKRHADDTAQLEKNYNEAVSGHQSEMQDTRNRHAQLLAEKQEQHSHELRETLDRHEMEKQSLVENHDQERGRLEAEHAKALRELREQGENERDGMRSRHEQQMAEASQNHKAELALKRDEHEQMLESLQGAHAAALEEKDQLHADELAGLRARHTTDTKASDRRHADELNKLAEAHKAALAASAERREADLRAGAQEHTQELESLAAEHVQERERLQLEHEAAVAALDQKRQEELQAQAAEHIEALERQKREHDQKLEQEIKGLRDSNLRKVQALEESHADLKAGMQQRYAQQLDELKGQHAASVEEFQKALEERDGLITAGQARVAELEAALNEASEREAKLRHELGETREHVTTSDSQLMERDRLLAERAQRISELEQESAGYQDQILKAYQRIKSDESIVSRAKKALAIALTLLDESNTDGSDEAKS